jgi:hypothetical protein
MYARENEDGDWVCHNCHGYNFSKRADCYRCGITQEQSTETITSNTNTGQKDIAAAPNSIVTVRKLDTLTTAQKVFEAVEERIKGLKEVRLMRFKETGSSRGFAFLVFNSVTVRFPVVVTSF